MPRWNVPKLTQGGVIVILVAATGAALTWLAQAPGLERGAKGPDLPAPPAPPALDTPDPFPAPAVPAAPAPPLPDAAHPAAATRTSPAQSRWDQRRHPRRRRERRPGRVIDLPPTP